MTTPTHRTTSWSGKRHPLPSKVRARILRRDGGICQLCQGVRCGNHPLEIDHRVPVAEGGTDDDANLQTVGRHPCHTEKTRAEQARGRERRARLMSRTREPEAHPGLRTSLHDVDKRTPPHAS